MKTLDFSYHLPSELIAQKPLCNRDQCKLLCLDKINGSIEHHLFSDISRLLKPGDRLVFNDTKVLPARVWCIKDTGALIEFLFVKPIEDECWQALVRPLKRIKQGMVVRLKSNPAVCLMVDRILGDGAVGIRLFSVTDTINSLRDVMRAAGEMPLPPYIKRGPQSDDDADYQTVYAKNEGAIAAPTAGLHFTKALLDQLADQKIDLSYVTLHVGIGTFRPVKVEDPLLHSMHSEEYELTAQTAEEILTTKRCGGRIVAVGTTVVRVLEHCALNQPFPLCASSGSTDIFILPGFQFKVVDALITNFHLPASTLLMLVSAFAGTKPVLSAYAQAVAERYRFFSYGDAMLIS